MNKTISFAAIAMFAVIMGMSAFAPAMAAPNNDKSSATTAVCHYFAVFVLDEFGEPVLDEFDEPIIDEELSEWNILYVSSKGAEKGHTNHGDNTMGEFDDPESCFNNQDGTFSPLV